MLVIVSTCILQVKMETTTSFAGTDILSAAGTASGYAEYTGGFDFADSLTSLIVEDRGQRYQLGCRANV